MRDRSTESDSGNEAFDDMVDGVVKGYTGLGEAEARLFHLEMWAFVHGIATMFATGFLELDRELVSRMLTDCYQGIRKRFEKE